MECSSAEMRSTWNPQPADIAWNGDFPRIDPFDPVSQCRRMTTLSFLVPRQ
jgi:hypothetical protein